MVDKEQIARVEVRQVSAAETVPLRHAVLRPGRPVETAFFQGDDLPSTKHFGAFRNGQLLCIASLFEAELPDEPDVAAVQLRGMATAAEAQRTGLGRALVLGCIAYAREKGARARMAADENVCGNEIRQDRGGHDLAGRESNVAVQVLSVLAEY
jgi:GNAT superfamily N-acetyltransferase